MGDRCYCTLQLVGIINKSAYQELVKDFEFSFVDAVGSFGYEEVNYAEPVEDHQKILKAGLSLLWFNAAGDEYSSSVVIEVPGGLREEYLIDGNEILVNTRTMPEAFEEARIWQSFIRNAQLIVIDDIKKE